MVVGIWNTSLPIGVPMLKRVAALPGQTVCRDGRMITVDGTDLAETLDRDRRGRPLPVWQGCQRIGVGEVFLMNRRSKDSLDGRISACLGPEPEQSNRKNRIGMAAKTQRTNP
jgi:type IV secretory pathway protease TraF